MTRAITGAVTRTGPLISKPGASGQSISKPGASGKALPLFLGRDLQTREK